MPPQPGVRACTVSVHQNRMRQASDAPRTRRRSSSASKTQSRQPPQLAVSRMSGTIGLPMSASQCCLSNMSGGPGSGCVMHGDGRGCWQTQRRCTHSCRRSNHCLHWSCCHQCRRGRKAAVFWGTRVVVVREHGAHTRLLWQRHMSVAGAGGHSSAT